MMQHLRGQFVERALVIQSTSGIGNKKAALVKDALAQVD